MRGLLVIGHGSRRDEANAAVRELARSLATDGGWDAVEPAYLEVVEPGIEAGYATLVRRGCTDIVVHPFFLFAGNHTVKDIPAALAAAGERFPGARWTLTAPLGLHPGVLAAVRARVAAAAGLDGARDAGPDGARDAGPDG
jgi:sirohydrochlorin ferrochelatase